MFKGGKPLAKVANMSTSVIAISNANARKVARQGSSFSMDLLPRDSRHHFTQSSEDLKQVFDDAANTDFNHLIIEGGDGTICSTLTALLTTYPASKTLPAISIVPSGTTNQIARTLGVKKPTDLARIFQGTFRSLSIPLVKIDSNLHPSQYGFLFSTGALPYVSQFAQDKLNAKGVGGGTAVFGAVIKAVTSERAALMPPAQHSLNGVLNNQVITEHDGETLGTVMTTLPTLMLGLDPFWGEEDAPLRLTWADATSEKLGRNVAGIWAGRKKDRSREGYHSHNIDRLELKTNAPATLDGDFIDVSGQSLQISTSRPLTFWVKK